MPIFDYKAVNLSGQEIKGKIEADTIESAALKVRADGLYLTNIELHKKGFKDSFSVFVEKVKLNLSLKTFGRVNQNDFSAFVRQLSTLLSSGLPLIRSLSILEEQQKSGLLKKIIKNLGDDVSAGSSFSEALNKYPKIFDKLFVSMIRAGETGGVLDEILKRLADFSEQSHLLKKKVRAAAVYPALVVCVAIIIVAILMIVVIPKFKDIFSELGASLPLPTMLLLKFSGFCKGYWWLFLLTALGLFYFYKLIIKLRKIRYFVDKVKLRLPILGTLTVKINVARFSRTLGTLLKSGVSILLALDISKDTCTNVMFEIAVSNVNNSIREGESIAKPLKLSNIFPPVVVNMIDVGEETGALDDMLLKVAAIYEQEIDVLVSTFTKLLEPILIIIMAFVVGYIVISMFLPLISMINALGG